LEKITKQETQYLISRGVLRLNKQGDYGDNLVVCGSKGNKYGQNSQNSQHRALHKQRFTTDYVYNKMLELQKQDRDKLTLNDIKDNQRYLFSGRLGVS